MKIGIISGRGISGLIKNSEKIIVETTYGNVSIELIKFGNHEIFFINRHGEKGNFPPHNINYRANIQAFSACHIKTLLSIGSVGSLNKNIKPGDFVIPHDFFDFTKVRPLTYFEENRIHIDMTDPFCPYTRNLLIDSCKKLNKITFHKFGVYLTTEGPRLETISEIKFFSNIADIVGMTLVPEIVLAREKNICYTSICIVCNMAAGLQKKLTANEISEIYTEKESNILKILKLTLNAIDKKVNCTCEHNLSKASI
jgi:5'-methylthioadenosine phosphorylase